MQIATGREPGYAAETEGVTVRGAGESVDLVGCASMDDALREIANVGSLIAWRHGVHVWRLRGGRLVCHPRRLRLELDPLSRPLRSGRIVERDATTGSSRRARARVGESASTAEDGAVQ